MRHGVRDIRAPGSLFEKITFDQNDIRFCMHPGGRSKLRGTSTRCEGRRFGVIPETEEARAHRAKTTRPERTNSARRAISFIRMSEARATSASMKPPIIRWVSWAETNGFDSSLPMSIHQTSRLIMLCWRTIWGAIDDIVKCWRRSP